MTDAKYGATREMLSQMVKDGQVKNLGRGQYVLPDTPQNIADKLTNEEGNVSSSGMSGHFCKEGSGDVHVNDQGEAEF